MHSYMQYIKVTSALEVHLPNAIIVENHNNSNIEVITVLYNII